MPPSRAAAGPQPPLAEPADNEGFRIWIPVPVAALGALLTVAAGLLVLGPGVAGSMLVLAFFVLLPGLAVVRLLGLHDAPLEVVLGIALSFAIAGLVSVIQAYFGGWSPTLTLGVLVATTVAAVLAPLVASLVQARRPRSSDLISPVAGSRVAWPSPAARSVDSPASVGAERRAATAPIAVVPGASFPPLGSLPGMVAPRVPATVAPPPTVMSAAPAQESPAAAVSAPVAPIDPAPAPRPSRARSRAASDLPPPPPVAIIRKRPKPASGSPAAGTKLGSRPNRATLSAINQIVDDLADDRDETQS